MSRRRWQPHRLDGGVRHRQDDPSSFCPAALQLYSTDINPLQAAPASRVPMTVWKSASALSRCRLAPNGRSSAQRSAMPVLPRSLHSTGLEHHHGQSPPYRNTRGFLFHNISKEESARTVIVAKAPRFAIADDLHRLFEESNIAVDKVLQLYDALGLNDIGVIPVVLKSPAQVPIAIKELNNAPLFSSRVTVKPSDYNRLRSDREREDTRLAFNWGWYANKSSSIQDIKLRYPRTSPPQGIFESVRQGRQVAFARLPADNRALPSVERWLYSKLHAYNVLSQEGLRYYQSRAGRAVSEMASWGQRSWTLGARPQVLRCSKTNGLASTYCERRPQEDHPRPTPADHGPVFHATSELVLRLDVRTTSTNTK
ncbi:hypothetical protein OPT61_g9475 [Boeremia exigua]|uniref:Uncharacterized protein n=1 Tax=Boeremia exigua TaxID=749465 RepID=A0ACC2HU31_9PLEO|nr:hypothetical protein OPT61_g9475 [Boeremia exigua]